jgi:hypothetical protein
MLISCVKVICHLKCFHVTNRFNKTKKLANYGPYGGDYKPAF